MFLATTAVEAFCGRPDSVLFLGAWCVPWTERHRLRSDDIVMPSVWDDRARFYDAAQHADTCAERLLRVLATHLDRVHDESRGVAYWRILLGPWIINYVHALYDRWVHLQAAIACHPGLHTVVLDPLSYCTPRTGPEMLAWLGDDPYNFQLFSQLLTIMGHRFPTVHRAFSPICRPPVGPVRRLLGAGERLLVQRLHGRVALTGVSLSALERWRVALSTRGRVVPMPVIDHPAFDGPRPAFDDRRNGLAGLDAGSVFERAVVAMLPANFPTLYLEGHGPARRAARALLERLRFDAILSETDWYANEAVKHLAAEAAGRGTRLIALQHGGGYGMSRFSPLELHERRISDRYLVWGWAEDTPCRNWPSVVLSSAPLRRSTPLRTGRKILFVATTQLRYLHFFNSQPAGTQMETYFAWQGRFLAALTASVRCSVRFRPHVHDYAQAVWPRIAARFPGVARDGRRSFARAVKGSRLVVIDHCGTAFLETLAHDIPTVLFWDPARWEVRSSAQPIIDALRAAKVLHDTPESAALHVADVYDKTPAWWQTSHVQAARRRLIERFALHRRSGVVAWASGLLEEVTA